MEENASVHNNTGEGFNVHNNMEEGACVHNNKGEGFNVVHNNMKECNN